MALNLDAGIPDGPISDKWDNHKFEMKLWRRTTAAAST